MIELEIQKYLRSGKTLADLENEYFVTSKRHGKYPNLILLKYNQIHSSMKEKIVQECRGIILDENDNWKIISRAFDKFFNYNEIEASIIDWSTARVQEKLDGSLIVIYPYNNEWLIQTSGSPDASGNVGNETYTFADLFWKIAKEQNLILPSIDSQKCFVFELMSLESRVIIPHIQNKIVLIGCRNLVSQKEINISDVDVNIPHVRLFSLKSFNDIIESLKYFSGLEQEGYVVVDGNFDRIKIKHPDYVKYPKNPFWMLLELEKLQNLFHIFQILNYYLMI